MRKRKREEKYTENTILEYNQKNKILNVIITTISILAITSLIIIYFLKFKKTDNIIITTIKNIIINIITNIKQGTILGSFYSTLFGGLFFITFPTELAFINFIKKGHNFALIILIYQIGLFIAYNINYLIGQKASNTSKKIITHKKFYKLKGILNKYGVWTIFVFNALPLPSQALSTILGVFKYNKIKFYIFYITGQITKYLIISLIILFFK